MYIPLLDDLKANASAPKCVVGNMHKRNTAGHHGKPEEEHRGIHLHLHLHLHPQPHSHIVVCARVQYF